MALQNLKHPTSEVVNWSCPPQQRVFVVDFPVMGPVSFLICSSCLSQALSLVVGLILRGLACSHERSVGQQKRWAFLPIGVVPTIRRRAHIIPRFHRGWRADDSNGCVCLVADTLVLRPRHRPIPELCLLFLEPSNDRTTGD